MVETLPPDIRLRLEQTLAQWRAWRCQPTLEGPPPIVRLLSGGLSNYTIVVGSDSQYVIRIDGKQVHSNRLSRTAEWRVLQSAHAASIAPGPRYFNPDLGAMVSDYHIEVEDKTAPTADIAALLRAIHAQPSIHYKLDLGERINNYERQIDPSVPQPSPPLRETALVALQQLSEEPQTTVLCHNDLLAANRLNTSSGLMAIDWEYCAMGSPWFDLAVVIVGDKINDTEKHTLINAYLQRAPTAQEQFTLERYCQVYRYLEQLWYLANKGVPLNP